MPRTLIYALLLLMADKCLLPAEPEIPDLVKGSPSEYWYWDYDLDKVRKAYQKKGEEAPDDLLNAFHFGGVLAEDGSNTSNAAEADRWLLKSLALEDPQVYQAVGRHFWKRGDRAKALELYEKATSVSVGSAQEAKLTAGERAWGEKQLNAIFFAHPSMEAYVKAGDALWEWSLRSFGRPAPGLRLEWAGLDPPPGTVSTFTESGIDPGLIELRISKLGRDGRPKDGETLWSDLVFEVFNVQAHLRQDLNWKRAIRGGLPPEDYAEAKDVVELETCAKARDFYWKVFRPHCLAKGVDLKEEASGDWFLDAALPEEWVGRYYGGHLDHYRSQYFGDIFPKIAEKDEKAAAKLMERSAKTWKDSALTMAALSLAQGRPAEAKRVLEPLLPGASGDLEVVSQLWLAWALEAQEAPADVRELSPAGLRYPSDLGAATQLGLKLFEKRLPHAGTGWLRYASDKGHAEAVYQLALCYLWGRGVTRDRPRSYRMRRQAADLGSVQAALEYGAMAMDAGLTEQGERYLELAGGKGNREAVQRLLDHYSSKDQSKADPRKREEWAKRLKELE